MAASIYLYSMKPRHVQPLVVVTTWSSRPFASLPPVGPSVTNMHTTCANLHRATHGHCATVHHVTGSSTGCCFTAQPASHLCTSL